MKIRRWTIDGFGVFHDFTHEDFAPGLNVFWGPNEAGKSTLLAFLRCMFFGFPTGERAREHYPPLLGGAHGGLLEVEISGENGEAEILKIERHAGNPSKLNLIFEDGRRGTEADLHRLLGNLDERLFHSVFAFSLSELQVFESLSDKAVRDHLYSATLAGESRLARDALRRLDEEVARLLPSRGTSRAAELVRELDVVRRRLSGARAALSGHLELARAEEQLLAERAELDLRSKELRDEIQREQHLIDLWPVAKEIADLRSELSALEVVESVPDDARARLAAVRENLKSLQGEASRLGEELRIRGAERKRLGEMLDDRLASVSERVDGLYENLGVHRQSVQKISDAEGEFQGLQAECNRALAQFDDWEESRIRLVREQDALTEEIVTWRRKFEKLEQRREATRQAFAAKASEVKHKTAEKQRLIEDLGASAPPERQQLIEQARAIRRMRNALGELRSDEQKRQAAEKLAEIARGDLEDLRAETVWKPSALLLPLALVLVVAGAGLSLWSGQQPAALPSTIAFGIISAVGLGLAGFVRSLAKRAERTRAKLQREETRLEQALAMTLDEADALRAEIADIKGHLEADADLLGITDALNFDALDDRDTHLREQAEARKAREREESTLRDTEASLTSSRKLEDRLAKEVTQLNQGLDKLREDWELWLTAAGLDRALDPREALELLARVDDVGATLDRRDHLGAECDRLRSQTLYWEKDAGKALQESGDLTAADMTGGGLIARFLDLRKKCDADRSIRQQVAVIDAQIADRRESAAGVSTQRQLGEETIEALHREVGATDDKSFGERIELFEQRRRSLEMLEAREEQLTKRLESQDDSEAIRRELQTARFEDWEKALIEDTRMAAEAQIARDDVIRQHGETAGSRRDLEESAELADLELEEQMLLTELRQTLDSFRINTLSQALIERTLAGFEKNRQPRVIAAASEIFRRVTNGRYIELRQTQLGNDLIAIESSGEKKSTQALSRGTAEQLYLSLRLALVVEFSRYGVRLPIVMDDVLVNFDPERARSMAEALLELGHDQQILLFSCQPQTAELLAQISDDVRIHELQSSEERLELGRKRIELKDESSIST